MMIKIKLPLIHSGAKSISFFLPYFKELFKSNHFADFEKTWIDKFRISLRFWALYLNISSFLFLGFDINNPKIDFSACILQRIYSKGL